MLSTLKQPGHACILASLVCVGLIARNAAAHIDLKQPPPRELGSSRGPNSDLKQGPCGQVVDGRTSTVSVFAPGETIDVEWEETVNHRSYYRIAFDRDGDDAFPTFAGPGGAAEGVDATQLCPVDGQVILAYVEDSAGPTHTLRVTLPDVECERCTLQVVQYMFDKNKPYYFQCADLALRRSAAPDAGAADAALDASVVDAAVLAEPRAAAGCSARIAPAVDAGGSEPARDAPGATDATGGTPRSPSPPSSDRGSAGAPPRATPEPVQRANDDGGCSLGTAPHQQGPAGALAMLVGALWYRYQSRMRGLRRSKLTSR